MATSKTHSVSVLYLLPLRLAVGLSFLITGQAKVASGNWGAAYATSLTEFINANIENAFAFYWPFLESVVLPHAGTFAVLLAWGELLVGFSIFLGLFTRFGASVGIFIVLNYLFTTGIGSWMPSLEVMYLGAMITLLICSAGRAVGADQILRSNRKIRLFT
jgi:thiosulfate dehydrogenase [quinone] large subunit